MPKVHFASSKDTDMFYLVRKKIPDPFFYVDTGKKKLVFLNALEIDAFNESNEDRSLQAMPLDALIKDIRELKLETSPLNKLAFALFKKNNLLDKEVSVSRHFPLDMADFLRSQGATLVVADTFLAERRSKTKEEIGHIRESCKRTLTAFERIEEVLCESVIKNDALEYKGQTLTSEYLKEEIERFLFLQDMENPEGLIISCGPHAAMPHHGGAGPIRPHETIVCDIFPRNRTNGYFADITRTYVKGTPSQKVVDMYDAVKKAQEEAMKHVAPGVKAADVHNVSAKIIKEAGFDAGGKSLPAGRQGYIHGLGHGVGLDVHEAPSLSPNSKDILEEGDVITIEPGLYYPEWGGVRMEDVVVVTKDGFDSLTNYKRNLLIA